MSDQKEEKVEGLFWGEMVEVQTLLMSLYDRERDPETFILRMAELLEDKKILDLATWNHVWDDINAIMKFVGFSPTEIKNLSFSIKEKYSTHSN